ncbi:conserved hypothetical protein [Alteromonas sp. 38]|uniref:hypothetical protein n=1 Tax=Alteromonas TaxID=226 RepID=UPI0012EF5D0D|nr:MULTISPECIES: hypothetical protein [Alteromonas]CAD5270752.1 conserved hypothetical protein [Alteromonas sp. 154]VXB93381.1 conserved hypothetical protein [Alteromonas sp. 38]
MSKDYRYQSEELDSVEEEDFHTKKVSAKRHQSVKNKQNRDLQRREKQRRLMHEGS